MVRRRRRTDHPNHERWLVSYADFITLLFAFFVVMYATSQRDKVKERQVSESVEAALQKGQFSTAVKQMLGGTVERPGPRHAAINGEVRNAAKQDIQTVDLATSLTSLTAELEKEIVAGRIHITMQPRGLAISFNQAALFPSGEDTVALEAYDPLAKVAAALLKIPNPVRFEGHTDSVPIHSARFRSNWDLSAARSIALLELFSTRFNVPRGRMSIGGYAETAPVDTNETEDGRARNRRVDLVILNDVGVIAEPGFTGAERAMKAGRGP